MKARELACGLGTAIKMRSAHRQVPSPPRWTATAERHDRATHFTAMADPCLVLVDTRAEDLGVHVGEIVKAEALPIKAKFSLHQPSVITHINENAGPPTTD